MVPNFVTRRCNLLSYSWQTARIRATLKESGDNTITAQHREELWSRFARTIIKRQGHTAPCCTTANDTRTKPRTPWVFDRVLQHTETGNTCTCDRDWPHPSHNNRFLSVRYSSFHLAPSLFQLGRNTPHVLHLSSILDCRLQELFHARLLPIA